MSSDYFDHKVKTYFLNMILKKPFLITDANSVRIWHEMFNKKELMEISKEFSKINKKVNIDFEIEEKNEKTSIYTFKQINAYKALKHLEDDILDIDSAEVYFGELDHLKSNTLKQVAGVISKKIEKKLNKTIEKDIRLKEIEKLFKLNEVETELMTLYYCSEVSEDFEQISQSHKHKENIQHPLNAKKFISDIVKIPTHVLMQALSKSSRLIKLGILKHDRCICMSSEFINFLSGYSNDALIDKYSKNMDLSNSLGLESHLIPKDKIETLKTILNSPLPCSILFYGKPGTGKTELAKTIAKEVKLDLYAINILDDDGEDDRNHRKRSLFAAQNHPTISENIILVDECDQLINSKPNYFFNSNSTDDQKAWLNEYLDTNKSKTIWITNSIECIDESIVRRFNYVLEFNELSNLQREKILTSITSKNNCTFLSEDDIKIFSKSEKLTSGHFSIALKTVGNLEVSDSKKKEVFTNIIKEHQNMLGSKPLRLKSINSNYCIKGLNIDQSPATVIEQSRKILQKIESDESDINLNTLLYGPPGTGKTEFVKYLGQELGKEILLKRASDLLSMWVGGSEKNIRKAFEDAEREKKILFIDEADSLLSSRDGHNRTWETTQVNEILTCMENFRGILLCATNHVDNLDMAAQRRFLFKLKFDYLDKDGVIHFYNKFFKNYVSDEVTQNEIDDLKSINGLTPSDFNNLKRKFDIIAPSNHGEILQQLQLEIGYKKSLFKKKVGI
ncbi:MAG: AAA family ATPase [Bacteriovorax sp.]|nr:AAA family ATPase [Bacteriovorax sp.]